MTRSDALAQKAPLLLKPRLYDNMVNAAAVAPNRYGRSQIKTFSKIDLVERQGQMDKMFREYRELDRKIQAANWTKELIDIVGSQ